MLRTVELCCLDVTAVTAALLVGSRETAKDSTLPKNPRIAAWNPFVAVKRLVRFIWQAWCLVPGVAGFWAEHGRGPLRLLPCWAIA